VTVVIRAIGDADIEPARRLLIDNGWTGARFAADRFPSLIAGAQATLVAVDGERVVGFARSLGDGVGNGYIATVVVDAAYRRQGVGRDLVLGLMGDEQDMTWVLRAARPDVQGFYEKLGFRRSTVAMERVRVESPMSDGDAV
jgi:ribosomal protein S18 acetylase RimI-like enzyme